jgi:hypothetical protein
VSKDEIHPAVVIEIENGYADCPSGEIEWPRLLSEFAFSGVGEEEGRNISGHD